MKKKRNVFIIFFILFSTSVVIILFCIYLQRVNIISKVNIEAYSADTSDISKIKVSGIGPIGREFLISQSLHKGCWDTKGFFLKGIKLEVPASFLNNDVNYIKINQHKFNARVIKRNFIKPDLNESNVFINIKSVNTLNFKEKLAFITSRLPEMIYGLAFFLAPLLYFFLIFIIIFDYKKQISRKNSPSA